MKSPLHRVVAKLHITKVFQLGDLCLLCLEPLTPSGAARLVRFNDFVSGEASKRADRARDGLRGILERIEQIKVPEVEIVEESLAGYGQIDGTRASIVADILKALTDFEYRRASLLKEVEPPVAPPDVTTLAAFLAGRSRSCPLRWSPKQRK